MPSASTPPASLSEVCCQRGHQLGTSWGPPTPSHRNFKPSGPGVRLPRTTERQTIALYVHLVVETQVPVILTWIQPSVNWAGQELRTPKPDSAQPTQANSASSMGTEESQPRATWTCSQQPPHLD